jgi:hypothetical protein
MSIDTPPIYSNVTYNSQFFPDNSKTGLNESEANALYLRKTFPDTAVALETFNGGIKVNTLDPTTIGGTIQIGHGSATNNVEIASEASRSVVLHLGDGDNNTTGAGIHIGNGSNSSNNVQILNGTYALGTTAGNVNILTGTNNSFTGGNMNLFTTSRGTLTVGGVNNAAITYNKAPTFTTGLTSNTISSTGGTNTIYTDPSISPAPQTYSTLVCSNNLACSFGASSGSCNLGGSAAGVNVGFNMPSLSGASISIGTAGVQDTNVLIATKGAIVTGTNKIQIGASANALSVASGTITLGTADTALSIGANSLQSSNIVIGTKGALITGTDKIVIGASANALSLSSGTINVNSPLTPNYNPSAIVAGQIGSAITPTYNTPFTLSPSVVKNIATYSLPIGVYFIQASIQTPTPVTYQALGISSASATIQYECWSNILTDSYIWFALCVSRMVVITSASTPYYVIAQAGDMRTLLQVRTQCFRIA